MGEENQMYQYLALSACVFKFEFHDSGHFTISNRAGSRSDDPPVMIRPEN